MPFAKMSRITSLSGYLSDLIQEIGRHGLQWSFGEGLPGVQGARYVLNLTFSAPGIYLLPNGTGNETWQVCCRY